MRARPHGRNAVKKTWSYRPSLAREPDLLNESSSRRHTPGSDRGLGHAGGASPALTTNRPQGAAERQDANTIKATAAGKTGPPSGHEMLRRDAHIPQSIERPNTPHQISHPCLTADISWVVEAVDVLAEFRDLVVVGAAAIEVALSGTDVAITPTRDVDVVAPVAAA
jgi:hypothetical protein